MFSITAKILTTIEPIPNSNKMIPKNPKQSNLNGAYFFT
tara:strand:- start:596 stop:712 length:117 start_codon:yes stop_codon:yes gene_type:complete